MLRSVWLIPAILFVLAACQTPTPTTAPEAPTAVATRAPTIAPASTPTTQPSPTPTATASAATATPTPSPTTVTATASPSPAATATTPAVTASPTQVSSTRDVVVTADGVNLRDRPSTSATVIQTLSQDTHLTAIGQPTTPDASGIAWQNVRADNGQLGWVAAQYLANAKPAMPTPSPIISTSLVVTSNMPAGYVYVASTAGLNLRADHSASADVLATLANGQRLKTNGLGFGPDENGITWLNVKTDDDLHEGWVSAEFVNTQVPSVEPATPPVNEVDIAAELLRRTNALRQQNGLPPYVLNNDLTQLALTHSQYMAQNGISHIGADGLSAKQRIINAGYGDGHPTENIYGGQATIDDAWEYWSTDPPHLRNLLDDVNTVIGIGIYKAGLATYYTQDFGKPAQ